MMPSAQPPLTRLLEQWACERPERAVYTWLDFDGGAGPIHTSYAELWRRAGNIASILRDRGLRGKPVVLLYPPGPDFAPAFFGTLLGGAIAAPVPAPRFISQYQRLEGVAADCGPGALLSTRATLDWLASKLPADSRLRAAAWLATDGGISTDTAAPRADHPRPNDIAFLQYTSGSTSDPRGVAVTHAALVHNLATITREFQPTPDARLLSWLPHFHDMGLIGGLLSPLTWGGRSVLMSPLHFLRRPLRWIEAIAQYGIEVSGAPNFAWDLCLQWLDRAPFDPALDLGSWRIAFVGAEPVRVETLSRFAERFAPFGFRRQALLPCYGLAEATLLVSCKPAGTEPTAYTVSRAALARGRAESAPPSPGALTLIGCGHAVQETQLRIVDPETRRPLGPNRVGELWIAGPQVSAGYWNRPGDPAFSATLPDAPGAGFLRSGDLGFLTEAGEFVFVDRLKDIIVLNGQNHACHDLERTVVASHPRFSADACAVVLGPGGAGPHLVAIAEFPPGAQDEAEAAAQAARGALFSTHGLPLRTVVFIPPGKLSRTTSGKLRRRATLDRLASGTLRVLAWSGDPLAYPPTDTQQ